MFNRFILYDVQGGVKHPCNHRGVSEWSKVVVLKTTGRDKSRGFKSHLLCHMRVSSNGKTTVSKTVNLGSSPCARAT